MAAHGYWASNANVVVGSQPVRRVYGPTGSLPPGFRPVQTFTDGAGHEHGGLDHQFPVPAPVS